jgi:DNA-binding SARP family transcriptional activator
MDKPVMSSVTLAEIYLEQGHIERSMEIYAELVKREPYNEAYKKRLAGLKKDWKTGQKRSGTLRKALRKKLW